MQLILLAKDHELYANKRLIEEATRSSIVVKKINPFHDILNLSTPLILPQNSYLLHRATGYRFDDIDIHFSTYYHSAGAIIVNPIHELKIFRDKGHQLHFFKEKKIPYVPTAMLRGEVTFEALQDLAKSWQEFTLDDNFILKTTRGSQGIGVMLIRGIDSLISILESNQAHIDERYLLQPYLKDNREFRLFFIKGRQMIFSEKIKSGSDFRGNRGRAEHHFMKESELPKSVVETFYHVLSSTESHYGAIDLLYAGERPYLLEMNCIPGFFEIENKLKLNMAKEILNKLEQIRRTE